MSAAPVCTPTGAGFVIFFFIIQLHPKNGTAKSEVGRVELNTAYYLTLQAAQAETAVVKYK